MYFYMSLGIVGMALVALGAIRYLQINDLSGYTVTFLGFLLITSYIEYLEKRSEVGKKLTWIRFIIFAIIFLVLFFSFF